ncbi:MAG: CehA/McbA family metallohydrolase [Lentisphaeria bacterium]
MNFYGQERQAFKANLHTHTTNSDGKYSPEEIIQLYSSAGYQVLAFTDHRVSNPVSVYDGKGMTLLSGMEIHPMGPRGILWHLLALGTPEDFRNNPDWSGTDAAAAIQAAGGLFFTAHPYWCGFTSAEIMSLPGSLGIEVYNTSTRYIGKAYNMQLWDECLDHNARYFALAVDDVHGTRDLFKGFTMICAENASPQALLKALKEGSFYASQGPQFQSISLENKNFSAEFDPCEEVILLSNSASGVLGATIDEEGPGSEPKTCQRFQCDLSSYPAGSYVRCQIKDSEGKYAWSNPFFL